MAEAEALLAERIRWVEDQGYGALAERKRVGDSTVVGELAGPKNGRTFAHETMVVGTSGAGEARCACA